MIQNPDSQASGSVRVTWMGTAGCRITDGETAFYIDPFVSRPGLLKVALRRPLVPRQDRVAEWDQEMTSPDGISAKAVIVGHSHFDHAMDAPFFAHRCGALLVGSQSTAWVGRGAGLPEAQIRIVAPGDVLELGSFRIRFLAGRHGPAFLGRIPFPGRIQEPRVPPVPAYRYRLGEMFALLIEHPEGTLVHNGSAGYLPGMFDQVRADVILQCLAGRKDSRALFDHIILPLGVRTVIPIHYDHFFAPLHNPPKPLTGVKLAEFRQTAAAYEDRCRVWWIPPGRPEAVFARPEAG